MTARSVVLLSFAALLILDAATAQARPPCGFVQALREWRATQTSRARPDAETYVDSSIYPMRVHYDLEDEDLVDLVKDSIEDAWTQQTVTWGWEAPGPDNGDGGSEDLDVYITTTAEGSAGSVQPETSTTEDGHARCTGFVQISRDLEDDDIRQTSAHEFNHVVQLWADCAEDDQFLEASAVYAEDWVDPSLQGAWHFVPHFQEGYYRSLDFFQYLEAPQYGSFIFVQYLAERYGDGTPISTRELWDDSTQEDFANTNTWMDALERWLEANWNDEVGTPQGDELYTELAWREFSEWRWFLGENDDGEHFEHGWPGQLNLGLELPDMTTVAFSLLQDGPLERDIRLDMAETSTASVPIESPIPGWHIQVELQAESTEDRWAMVLFSVDATGAVLDRQVGEIDLATAFVEATVPEDTRDTILILANVGDGVLNPNENDWDTYGGTFTVTAEGEMPADDDDDSAAPDDDDGCECDAAGYGGSAPIVLVLMLVGMGLRRVRR